MPLSVSSSVRQLSDGSPAGTVLGQSAADLISLYNATPTSQASGNAQAALTRGQAGGVLGIAATSQSPTSIGANTSTERGITVGVTTASGTGLRFQCASGDVVLVNKPSSQAGLAAGNARVSGTGVAGVTFTNYTTATVTPTAGEKYGVVAFRGLPSVTPTLTPASVGPSTTAEQIFTVTGIRAGEAVIVNKPTAQAGLDIVNVRAVGNNSVGVTFANATGTTITPTAGEVYTFASLNQLDMMANVLEIEANVGAAAGPAQTATAEQSFTVTGLLATDTIIGVTKPTAQAGSGIVGARVSGANSLGVTFLNTTATVTPTSFEVYGVTLFRPAPAQPVQIFNQALTPTAVGPNTTVSQSFTVTGVVSGAALIVNKNIPQPGLGLGGFRVSGTNVIEITFVNATAATITPTAGEVYTIAQVQPAIPDAGNTWVVTMLPWQIQAANLLASIRNALAGLGAIAGA